ncbi:hypothetical protein SMACR_01963 [Sordaria macrospora]|uniref:WGS project CABT00000000 data, contig 2.5 n=2 Tax=Sordaria macrospora TaxID=5147 RepID=F7VSD3_SORMK|nr:uncharacterized protein SMAC_01963 [Sordaria macrospora k-hell]KAA8629765.1 hypothetical protein SMACR_01963 [Sordaria macrospora]WPJ63201.1 hypothetical protein SMAC4_01963 [Sordaria macrospora]CCC08419.1 unnamed protein product [Sordaria macrospora k-hell]
MGKKGGGRLLQAAKAANVWKGGSGGGPPAKKQKKSHGPGPAQHQKQQSTKPSRSASASSATSAAPPPLSSSSTSGSKKQHKQKQHSEPSIPFSPDENILLVGDGDLSFAVSLVEHYHCTNLTATVYEKDLDELSAKYPHVRANVDKICAIPGCKVLYNVDARRMAPFAHKSKDKQTGRVEQTGTMDRIIFNFPHVGGKSTDVNRQVRYNQELLVDFFKRSLLSLAPGGSIIVTLFEGEPYTLWNIRDLARHSDLAVKESFKFQARAYPGYHHARTLGVVKNKKGEAAEKAWKGEERPARSYVFVRKDDVPKPPAPGMGKKRKAEESDDEDEEEEDEDHWGSDDFEEALGDDGEGDVDDDEAADEDN